MATIDNGVEKFELLNMPTKYTSISFSLLVDSGSPAAFGQITCNAIRGEQYTSNLDEQRNTSLK